MPFPRQRRRTSPRLRHTVARPTLHHQNPGWAQPSSWGTLMSIPPLDPQTGYLPGGDHPAKWSEFEERFTGNIRRRELLQDLHRVVKKLRDFGATRIWIDGTFVTSKERPGDVDVLYELPPGQLPDGSWGDLHPARQKALKKQYRIDLWRHPAPQGVTRRPLHDVWATDRDDVPKGMILLEDDDDSK